MVRCRGGWADRANGNGLLLPVEMKRGGPGIFGLAPFFFSCAREVAAAVVFGVSSGLALTPCLVYDMTVQRRS